MEPIRKDLYFTLSAEDALRALGTSAERGLTDEEARRRLAEHGANRLKEGQKKSLLQLFAAQLNDPLIFILLIAAAV
ncbi:MAG: cation-transporting P-type ATPase, partial [Fretibacterium sp.]|nr:cation-transporting P-type ATPase [Fretibacterium sp.]